ncbi:unnamed protein product [Ectocarpus fasciculatus]
MIGDLAIIERLKVDVPVMCKSAKTWRRPSSRSVGLRPILRGLPLHMEMYFYSTPAPHFSCTILQCSRQFVPTDNYHAVPNFGVGNATAKVQDTPIKPRLRPQNDLFRTRANPTRAKHLRCTKYCSGAKVIHKTPADMDAPTPCQLRSRCA